ncbi:hypothetical protein ACRALDRAFT_209485 [Sodiomyces alcalophilus JCM 7366]|uniref:uncharacterized protein n=1 Tax=Sodiomyces alcalophilus JCM 7366 TaxID=591952 RepID=UPI0039B4CBC6
MEMRKSERQQGDRRQLGKRVLIDKLVARLLNQSYSMTSIQSSKIGQKLISSSNLPQRILIVNLCHAPHIVAGLRPFLSCTTALFLSGYALQQRTFNQLRTAIKQQSSRPSAKPYLPDRFHSTTTELEDGTIIVLELGGDAGALADTRTQSKKLQREQEEQSGTVIEIKPSVSSDTPMDELVQKVFEEGTASRDEVAEVLRLAQAHAEAEMAAQSERERNLRLQTDRNQLHPDPAAETQKPLSRAERRKLIKEEIRRLSYDDEPVYYQRRLH